jgi:hypothetical protein
VHQPYDLMPWYQDGRASQVWPSTTRVVPGALLLPPPPSTDVAEVQAEPDLPHLDVIKTNDTETADDTRATDIDIASTLSINRPRL